MNKLSNQALQSVWIFIYETIFQLFTYLSNVYPSVELFVSYLFTISHALSHVMLKLLHFL